MNAPKFDYKGGNYRAIAVCYTLEQIAEQMKYAKPEPKKWLLDALILKSKVENIWARQTPEDPISAISKP